jgi:colicin import membrane protein
MDAKARIAKQNAAKV